MNLENFIKEFKFDSNIIFFGLQGRGKSYIMKKMFEKLPKNDGILHKFWIDDGEFREKITSGHMNLKPCDSVGVSVLNYPLELCIRCKVLFFDDLGSSKNISPSQKTKFKFILDEREKKELITIFSTNCTPSEIGEYYGEKIKSRIYNGKHPKGLKLIEITGKDRRKENIETLKL